MDVKPLQRRMRAKCKVCKKVFVTEKRLRVRQTCSDECYVKLQEVIKQQPIECAICSNPIERVRESRQRRTCSDECLNRLLRQHNNTQKNNACIAPKDPFGPQPGDPSPAEIAEFYRQQAELRWASANYKRMKTID